MADLLFYQRVVPLNEQAHAALRLATTTGHRYAAATNAVPLLAAEFFDCAREYPLVFVDGAQGPVPMALLGLRDNENLFVDAAGTWSARYVPAFVRRYPFVPAKGPQGELTVCIDEAAPNFSRDVGEPLFAEGKPTPVLERALSFLREFQRGVELSEQMTQRIKALGLLRSADSVVQLNDGQQFRLNGLQVVDEARLRALAPEVVQELFANGTLAAIHAHLVSLGNLGALADKLAARTGKALATAA